MSDIPDRVRKVMGDVNNLHVLATVDADGKPHMRWMGAFAEDPGKPWTFYLVCTKGSRKLQQLAANPHAELLFSNPDTWEVASVAGVAEEADSPEARQLVWVPHLKDYYSGPDDPNMTIIRFTTRCMELLAMTEGGKVYCFEVEE